LMKEINPSIMETIQDTSMRLTDVASIYHQERKKTLEHSVIKVSDHFQRISIDKILMDIAPASFLYELLSPLGFNISQIKDIHRSLEHSQAGKRFISKNWELIRDREDLLIQRIDSECIVPELIVQEIERTPSFILPKDKHIACLDADKVKLPLTIRKWQVGDKFIPFGMNGKKKISDYMTNKKFSLFQKENQYVVCSEDKIVWLVNERCDNRYRITDQTRRILLLKINGCAEI